jgi:hypothetical protein
MLGMFVFNPLFCPNRTVTQFWKTIVLTAV